MVVKSTAEAVHEGTHAADYGTHFPWCFVSFKARSEACYLFLKVFHCSVEVDLFGFGDLSSRSPYNCKLEDLTFKFSKPCSGFILGERLVNFCVAKMLGDTPGVMGVSKEEAASTVFVCFQDDEGIIFSEVVN